MRDKTRTAAARQRTTERRAVRARKAWLASQGQDALDRLVTAHVLNYHVW